MPETTRKHLLRLAQFSPLAAVALFALVWFSVPAHLAPYLVATPHGEEQGEFSREMRQAWVDSEETDRLGAEAGVSGVGGSFQSAVTESWNLVTDRQSEFVTTSTIEPLPFGVDDPVFESLAEWEERSGGHVWAWMLSGGQRPALVASATGDPTSLEALERERAMLADLFPATAQASMDVADHLWNSDQSSAGALAPVNPQAFRMGDGGGGGGGGLWTWRFTSSVGGRLWYWVFVESDGSRSDQTQWRPVGIDLLDPHSAGFAYQLQDLAESESANLFVFGPLDSELVPLRVPASRRRESAGELGAALWPDIYATTDAWGTTPIQELEPELQVLANGRAAYPHVVSMWTTLPGFSMFAPDEIAPQSILYVAVFDEMPGGDVTPLDTAWLSWRRFVSGWFPALVGGTLALLVLSLVASPTAFVLERRAAARVRVRQEMERVQRDAHDKVYNRLSALSKRVAAAGDAAANEYASSLGDIADDIRQTVGELQGILGEEVRHADATLTSQPLAEQIASVCTAQAARLGVVVELDAPGSLPDVEPGLGWDLQCIAEEAITNAVRHGGAGHISVGLAREGDELVLRVRDDGSGSRVVRAADAAEGSTGLRGMEQRTQRHGGALEIASDAAGSTVTARAPLV